jgi:hypothetical protein
MLKNKFCIKPVIIHSGKRRWEGKEGGLPDTGQAS